MKKLFGVAAAAAVLAIGLASCNNSQDLESLRKDAQISDELKSAYKINFDSTTGSKRLYKDDRGDNKSYFDVYVAEDYKSSLLRYTISLGSLKSSVENLETKLEQRKLTAIPVKTLGFSNSLYNDESGNFIKEIYNSNYGLTSTTKAEDGTVNKNYDFGFDIDSEASWTRSLTGKYINEAYLDNKSAVIDIVVTYLPIYLNRVYNGNEIVKLYMFLPISEVALLDGKKIVAPENGSNKKYGLEATTVAATPTDFVFNSDTGLLKTESLIKTDEFLAHHSLLFI